MQQEQFEDTDHPNHPGYDYQDDYDDIDDQIQQSEFFQIIDNEEFTNVDSQLKTHITQDLGAKINKGFFFSFLIYQFPQDNKKGLKGFASVVQTGSTARKNIQLQISPENILTITYRIGKQKQQLVSQVKLKPRQPTHIFLQLQQNFNEEEDEDDIHNSNSLSLYINGIVQGQVTLTQPIENPNGFIFIGSEQLPVFKGEIQDMVFGCRPLNNEEIKLVSQEKLLDIEDQRTTLEVLDEYKITHHKMTQPQRKETLSAAQRHAIPQNLSKTHMTFQPKQEVKQEEMKEEELQKYLMETARNNVENLLISNDSLNNKCRELAFAFKWVFNTLYMLSPPVEDKGAQCLPLECLNKWISSGDVASNDPFPFYGIEFDRFMKVIQYAQIPLNRDEVHNLAQTSTWLRKYKYKNGDNQMEVVEGILYDKFMITIRDSCMTEEEIQNIRKECDGDPHETSPKEGDEIDFDSYQELLNLCRKQEIPEEEARQFMYCGFKIKHLPLKGGKPIICCNKDPRLLFFKQFFAMYPDFKTNPDTVEKAFLTCSKGESIVSLEAFTQFCIYDIKVWGDYYPEEENNNQNLGNTHMRTTHEQPEDCCKKLFSSFCFDIQPFFGYNEFVTLLCASYPVIVYKNQQDGRVLEVSPYSALSQNIVWAGAEDRFIENDPETQMLGEIRFKNDEEINFLSAETRILQKQKVQWSERNSGKKWKIIGSSEDQFGKWELNDEKYDFKIDYRFQEKQKLMLEFQEDNNNVFKLKLLVQELVGVDSQKIGSVLKLWQHEKVNGTIDIQRQIIGTSKQSFIDYIMQGLKLNFSVAIDWTASNLDVDNSESLHYCNPERKKWSPYQNALKILGDSILAFDDDKKVPMYGFGAEPEVASKMQGTFDCFPMNGNKEDPSVEGIQGILDCYNECREKIKLSGSTQFSPILQKMVGQTIKKSQTNYQVSLIMTDGILDNNQSEENQESELQKVKNIIVDSSDKPITFIIVGVGSEVLDEFQQFNSYKQIQNSVTNKTPIRQNSIYVNFNELGNREELSEQVLSQLKIQIVTYYKMHNIQPENLNQLSDPKITALHLLHPDHFKKLEEEKAVAKNATSKSAVKGKKDSKLKQPVKQQEKQEDNDFEPQYIKVNSDEILREEEESQAQILIHLDIKQEQPQHGSFQKIFLNQQLPEIKEEELNQVQNFYNPNKVLAGIKTVMQIKNQVVSEIPNDKFLTINSINIKTIQPIWQNELQIYEYPSETAEQKEVLPKPCEQWNQGKFLLNLQRCANCKKHQQTSWHDEADFAERQNEFIALFKGLFPNLEVISNHEKPNQLECFDVYIRGVGPFQDRDEQGRIFLFKKQEELQRFINNFERRMVKPFDLIVLMCSAYADSTEMEKVQAEFFEQYADIIPKKWENVTEGNCEIPERPKQVEEQRQKDNQISVGTRMTCTNWGCKEEYEYSEDKMATANACLHHPGTYQMGSIHGLWPESWTCCRQRWEAEGCQRGSHKGQQSSKLTKLCLARGAVNPRTEKPDSYCGKQYLLEDPSECRIHTGYMKGQDQNWTCCEGQGIQAEPCATQSHVCASWPDDEAKQYFIEKPLITDFRNETKTTFRQLASQACIYRKTEPYQEFVSRQTKITKDRLMNEDKPRVCMHYGCNFKGTFKDQDNRERKQLKKPNCWYHPGVFDFGRKQSVDETCHWKPHWTCCIKPWNSKGCTQTYHWGPLQSDFESQPPKHGKWPSVSTMKNFNQKGSLLWKKKFQELQLDEDSASQLFYRFTQKQETCSVDSLAELADLFKLNLLVMSEDLSYLFKQLDVQEGRAEAYVIDPEQNNMISRKKFLEWWFKPLDDYPVHFDQVE